MAKNTQLLVDIGQAFALAIGLPTLASWGIGSRPKNAKRGTFGFNTETNALEYFDGEVWFKAAMKSS